MKSPQFLVKCAVIGFAVSFLAGFIASVGFGTVMLRSFLFAVLAAITGFGLRLLVNKFLLPSDDALAIPTPQEKSAAPVGEVVDITVDDLELPDDNSSTVFAFQKPVFGKKSKSTGTEESVQPVGATDSFAKDSVAASDSNVGFSPVSPEALTASQAQPDDVEDIEALEPESAEQGLPPSSRESTSNDGDDTEDLEELEELEDMPDIGASAPSVSASSDKSASGGGTTNGIRNAESAIPVGDSNSVEIAKAIRTVLLRDS